MNLGAVVDAAFQATPADAKGPVTFTRSDGATSTGIATGAAARGSQSDTFAGQQLTRTKARTLTVWPTGNDWVFAPEPAMKVLWGAVLFTVVGVAPVAPNGGTPIAYRVAISR